MEALAVFSPADAEQSTQMDPAVEEKIKYSKWRAAEIARAVKENRPASLPTSADVDLTVPDVVQDAVSGGNGAATDLHQDESELPPVSPS